MGISNQQQKWGKPPVLMDHEILCRPPRAHEKMKVVLKAPKNMGYCVTPKNEGLWVPWDVISMFFCWTLLFQRFVKRCDLCFFISDLIARKTNPTVVTLALVVLTSKGTYFPKMLPQYFSFRSYRNLSWFVLRSSRMEWFFGKIGMIGIEVLAYIDLASNFFFELAQLTQKKCCREWSELLFLFQTRDEHHY